MTVEDQVKTMTPQERCMWLVALVRHVVRTGELEASTVRTLVRQVEEGM